MWAIKSSQHMPFEGIVHTWRVGRVRTRYYSISLAILFNILGLDILPIREGLAIVYPTLQLYSYLSHSMRVWNLKVFDCFVVLMDELSHIEQCMLTRELTPKSTNPNHGQCQDSSFWRNQPTKLKLSEDLTVNEKGGLASRFHDDGEEGGHDGWSWAVASPFSPRLRWSAAPR